ncbi:hypothetical protein LUZ62_063548 [Rhynchospora pubera]|uniref:VHS domain-containing protein n=1 Tax=Rhynchospora pubera TaxID=906938 RepID=A0AAV8EM66_9POAL|nr:hypothetical protein LUZ62_057049 [Rhynchospora pubera]KAJ4779291.1 hypothetical protein LUZ62_063548 [Rhynchospora pubera]
MASGVQKGSNPIDRFWHRDIYQDGNNVADKPEHLLASNLTTTQAFSTDNLNSNITPNLLLNNCKNRQEVIDLTSSATINYISQILLEEDFNEEISIYQEKAALRDIEKSFYGILEKEYPTSPNWPQFQCTQNQNSTGNGSSNTSNYASGYNVASYNKYKTLSVSGSPISALSLESLPAGSKEAMKFLPIEQNRIKFHQEPKHNCSSKNDATGYESSAKMSSFNEESGLSGEQPRKQRAIFLDKPVRNKSFDELLLSHDGEYFEDVISLRQMLQKEMEDKPRDHFKDQSIIMAPEMIEPKEVLVDLWDLLIRCSEAVSVNNINLAYELIKQIRKHSSHKGDSYQRMAYYLVDGLEARLDGTGCDIYYKQISNQGSASDLLKGFRIYHAVCPYPRASYFFANETILNISKNASKVHIIDFGIELGFQWPSFFERLASLGNTHQKIRITGISFPDKGLRPAKTVEETGRRLSEYAQRFNIRFKYQGIASKWENIQIKDLKIDKEEVLIVSSLYCFRNLGDETINMISARDKVLRMIRMIKPCVFIHGIVNSSYSNPFFTMRFKQVLSSFFSFFDMLESTMPRQSEGRLLIERTFLGPNAFNAIACEGSERVERPEKYRQWQARNLRAGFEQLPVNSMIKKKIESTVRGLFHKEFVVDENNKWLLLGWKGTIVYALSTWKPQDFDSVRLQN